LTQRARHTSSENPSWFLHWSKTFGRQKIAHVSVSVLVICYLTSSCAATRKLVARSHPDLASVSASSVLCVVIVLFFLIGTHDASRNSALFSKSSDRIILTTQIVDGTEAYMATSPESHEFSREPSQMLRCVVRWLRGFHLDRERSKAADWALVILTFFTVIAAVVSAWFFQQQLVEARRSTDAAIHNFTVDERAWVELEPIKGTLSSPRTAKIGAGFSYPIYIRNVGKNVARDVRLRASRTCRRLKLESSAQLFKVP
jgi:hypothetical protein